MPRIDQRSALATLTKPRLLEIAGALHFGLPGYLLKDDLIEALASSPRAPFPQVLDLLKRDELKAICRAAGLDDSGREKAQIAERILGRADGHTVTLTKAELIEAVAQEADLTKQLAELLTTATFDTMIESLHVGEEIEVRGFGSFRLRRRRARIGRNPRTGEEVQVPAKRVCYFKPGKELRSLERG